MVDIDVLVLRRGTHGMPTADYAAALRERLPDYTVALAETPQEELELAPKSRVISSVHLRHEILERATGLELFAGVAAGYDHLPLERLSEAGVIVTNASGIHAPNIAEQVLAYILGFTRNLKIGRDRQERGVWQHFQTDELKGSTATIIGLGAIGQAVTQRISAFEVDTIGVRYTPEKGGPTDKVIGFEEGALQCAFAETDYLVVASPLTETTRGLIDTEAFDTLPPDAYLVNVGRGPIVETEALVDALRSNAIGGAGLDVTDPEPLPREHPLWGFDNVTITPHNAGHSPEHWERLADIVAENVHKLDQERESLRNVVQAP